MGIGAGSRVDYMNSCKVVTAALDRFVLPVVTSPQMAAAMTTGSSSLIVICKSLRICSHVNWNQKEDLQTSSTQLNV